SRGASPPGMPAACTANTGRIRNRPSIRNAKIDASEALARSSSRVMPRGSESRGGELACITEQLATGYISRLAFRAIRPFSGVFTAPAPAPDDGFHTNTRRPNAQSEEHQPRVAA